MTKGRTNTIVIDLTSSDCEDYLFDKPFSIFSLFIYLFWAYSARNIWRPDLKTWRWIYFYFRGVFRERRMFGRLICFFGVNGSGSFDESGITGSGWSGLSRAIIWTGASAGNIKVVEARFCVRSFPSSLQSKMNFWAQWWNSDIGYVT